MRIILFFLVFLVGSSIKAQEYSLDSLKSMNDKGLNYGIQKIGSKLFFLSSRKHRMHASFYADSIRNTDIFYKDSSGIDFLPRTINSTLHEGPFSINKTRDTIVFSRSLKGNKQLVALFYSIREDTSKHWQKAERLTIKQNASFFGHPHFGEDGKFYFSSDAEGGYGALDIYKSDFKDGKIQNIENLGPSVNTTESEAYPFLSSGILYYSSNRPAKYAGINIFSYVVNASIGSIILDEPINSDFDDFAYVSYDGGKYGYFSSNREGKDKVYKFNFVFPEFIDCEEQEETYLCYDLEESTYQDADTLPLKFVWDLGRNDLKTGRKIHHCFADTGFYEISVSLVDTTDESISFELANYELEISKSIQVRMKAPDTLKLGVEFFFKPDLRQLPGFSVQDVYWDFDEGLIRTWMVKHTYKEAGTYYPSVSVLAKELSSGEIYKFCTYKKIVVIDSSEFELNLVAYDDFEYNRLSLDEDSLDNIYKLEDADLMFAVQIHESDTLFENTLERFPNVEDKIYIRELHNDRFSYEVLYSRDLLAGMGNSKEFKLIDSSSNIISFEYQNFMNDSSFVTQFSFDDASLLFGQIPEHLMNQVIEADTSDPIAIVYFDLNSSYLDAKSKELIRETFKNLKDHQKLALYGYTDATGTNKMNDVLANERVEAVYNELERAGLAARDIVKRGYGSKFASLKKKDGKIVENRDDRKVELRIIE